ncbi:polymeric immunoglobulin receptor-like [Lepisosteus oculatus]|uniref:polymeric immunoglobulin receptor-like n=1 Tax=Lepisosteus oculatus TaxID=7918 RepID=UPI0035F50366
MRTLTVLGLLAAVWGALRTEGFSVQGPRKPLVARPGDEVLLPCSVDSTVPLQELEVEWLRTDPDTLVLLFSEGESRPESQHQSYRGRAELFPQEIPRGNFSLRLERMMPADTGVYRCAVYTAQGSGETTVELKEKKSLVVTGADRVVTSYPGGEVVLNCSVDTHVPPEELEVEWLRTDSEVLVLLFSEGESRPESQHQSYRGRAELFPQEIPRGNFSLRLERMMPEDAGVYRCAVYTAQDSGETTVELKEKKSLVVTGADRVVTSYPGGEVVLNCSVDTHIPPEELEVEWLRTDSEVLVLLFSEGESRPESQHQSYRGRAELFPQEIPRGNFSLRLERMMPEDAGVYRCAVYTAQDSGETTVELKEKKSLVVTGADRAVVSYPGGEVVLNCSVDTHLPPEQLEVQWRRTDSDVLVHAFSEGDSWPESQHLSYRGRAELFPQEIPRGNFSLWLKDVRTEDKGQFVCRVFGEHESAEATAELIELGFSSIHVGALVLAFSAPVLWILVCICIRCYKDALALTLLIASYVILSISFVLWGVIEGSLEEVIMCVTVNLLRIVPLLAAFMEKSVSISFSIIHFVVITVMWSVALWEYFKSHTPDTAVTADIGMTCASSLISSLCGVYIEVRRKHIWRTASFTCSASSIVVLVLFRASIERLIVGYLTALIVALIALVVCLTLQRICLAWGGCGAFCKEADGLIFSMLLDVLSLLVQNDVLDTLREFCRKGEAVIVSMLLFVLSLLYLASDLDTLRGGPGLMCEVLFLWILAVGTVFTEEDGDEHEDVVVKWIFRLGIIGLPLVNSTALATDLILKASKGYRAVIDLRLVVVPWESLFVICCAVRLMYNYYKYNKNKNNEPEE